MKAKLEGSICYLAGPIDYAPDQGRAWRKETEERLKHLKINFLDPNSKVKGLSKEVNNDQDKVKRCKKDYKWKELSKIMKKIVREDLRCIDYSDFIIAYVNSSIHMCGTYHEIIIALNQKKPVFIVVEGGKKKSPSWLFGICDYKYMFDNFEDLFKFVINLDNGDIKMDNKWVLIRKQLAQKKVAE